MANVLAVFAHPDDEVLGCGGTLAKHAEQGDKVYVLICGREQLASQALESTRLLGASMGIGSFPDQRFDTIPFQRITDLVSGHRDSDIIYTHHPGDLNHDHALVARAVLTAFRPKPGEKPRTILGCEVLSSTEYTYPRVFQPNWYAGLTRDQIDKAQNALKCYGTEVQYAPHPRSAGIMEDRARVRGSEGGVEYAEAFQLLRAGPF